MMRNNGLLKWTLHKNKNGTNGKNWQHPPDALTSGHIAYLVKFLGVTEAEHPKGIDVVKDCIRKLKLDEEIRRAEGLKTPKVEVTISVDGVAVQEPKGKKILHQFPLHQISYCADDKAEKKYFTFIAKEGEYNKCFVFASDKLAEEITLTIGQAFDLAYRRFLESSGRELELKREIMVLQKRIAELENENTDLKQKIMLNPETNSNASTSSMSDSVDLLFSPPVPPRSSANVANQLIAEFAITANEIEKRANVGRQQDILLIDEELDSNNKMREGFEAPPKICPPPPKGKKIESSMNGNITNNNSTHILSNGNTNGTDSTADIFGSDPFFTTDPFGMTNFSTSGTPTISSGNPANNPTTNMNGIKSVSVMNGNNNSSSLQSTTMTTTNTTPTSPYNNINSGLFNTNTMSMNMLNQFSFQQQQPAAKPAAIDSALQILDKRIEEMKLGFSRGIFNDDFPLEQFDPVRKS